MDLYQVPLSLRELAPKYITSELQSLIDLMATATENNMFWTTAIPPI